MHTQQSRLVADAELISSCAREGMHHPPVEFAAADPAPPAHRDVGAVAHEKLVQTTQRWLNSLNGPPSAEQVVAWAEEYVAPHHPPDPDPTGFADGCVL